MVHVTIDQGILRGSTLTDYRGDNYFSFRGIPYAKPPLGPLRFRPPLPPDTWTGERDATKVGDSCYGHDMMTRDIIGGEDCLFLNVYTPCVPSDPCDIFGLLAVMVWIHGGMFTTGSGNPDLYGPEYLVANDVVVVTLNYRLGILGNLAVRDEIYGIPGNTAIRDVVMALKWVQGNIEHFLGNPANVTVFGVSAGATITHHLVFSPIARSLIHKAIVQSGCAVNVWSYGKRFLKTIADLYHFDEEGQVVDMLMKMPVEEILKLQDLIDVPPTPDIIRTFGPIVDNIVEDPVVPILSADVLLSKNYQKIPLMIGYTSREGILFDIIAKRTNTSKWGHPIENLIPFDLELEKGSEMSKKVAHIINTFYFNGTGPSNNTLDEDYMLRSDIFFLKGIHRTAKNHNSVVFLYRMSVESELNVYKKFSGATVKGACHLDDVFYLWNTDKTPKIVKDTLEDISILRMTRMWTNFAKYGHPTPDDDDPLLDVTWNFVEDDALNFLDIGEKLTPGVNPEKDRMDLWEKLYTIITAMNLCNTGLSVHKSASNFIARFLVLFIFWLF